MNVVAVNDAASPVFLPLKVRLPYWLVPALLLPQRWVLPPDGKTPRMTPDAVRMAHHSREGGRGASPSSNSGSGGSGKCRSGNLPSQGSQI